MNEEIKEILENIKKQNEWEGVEYFRTPLSNEDADKLLKCITNLQQENEILKELNICVGCENNPNYKSRCEKATELYKNCKEEDYCILSLNMYEVLNGGDENGN